MHESAHALAAWESFYVIVGSSGGALIGLQFVVITLIADNLSLAGTGAISAFGTPTVVHFTNALAVSAILSAPWPSFGPPAIVLGACGATGLLYGAIVIRRARRQTDYQPVWEDWMWYAALPMCSYAAILITAMFLRTYPAPALFAVAASALALLFIGIHNAWDTVTHVVISGARQNGARKD